MIHANLQNFPELANLGWHTDDTDWTDIHGFFIKTEVNYVNDRRNVFRCSGACSTGNIKIHNRRGREMQSLVIIIDLLRNSAFLRLRGYVFI